MFVPKGENKNTKRLAYMSLVCPTFEYGSACCESFIRQINSLDQSTEKSCSIYIFYKNSDWETLAQRKTTARLCSLLKRAEGIVLGKLYVTCCGSLLLVWGRSCSEY